MEKLKGQRLMREQAQERLRDPQHRWALRIKFLQQVKTYIGVPYSRKYHQPGTAEHESALFLDCCGLVRRAMRDLHQDFGFALGPGNQCYQYDTLPITLSRPQCMRPGDLVFISWTYFSPFMKRQPHDIVHVEVWLGEGEKTVGARWHQGKVQEFPSYQFVSSSYGNMRYHFKSIETWLSGACVSHCRDHRWRLPDDKHNGKSIFSSHHLDQQAVMSSEGWGEPSGPRETGVCGAQEELCLGAVQYNSETKQGLTENFGRRDFAPSNTVGIMLHFNNTRNEQQEAKESKATEGRLSPRKWRSPQEQKGTQVMQLKAKGQDRCTGLSQDERCLQGHRMKSPSRLQRGAVQCERSRAEDPQGPGPYFFVGGGNGAAIVASYCEGQGWQRISDKTRDDYTLKWCETKSIVTNYNFRPGEQLLYQIPNNKVLTTKIGLLSSLREYDRVSSKVSHGRGPRRLKMEEFFPVTFRMDIRDEREVFFAQQKETAACGNRTDVWICKPTGLNQGRGIFLLRTQEEISAFHAQLKSIDDNQNYRRMPFRLPQARIVQRYVQNPLLLQGRKFDVRSYFLIACTTPYMVFFRHGYVRLTCDLYDPNSNNLSAHLTNQYVQKKNPLYSELKEETVWSMERFNAYVNEELRGAKGLPQDWVLGAFTKKMKVIIIQCFLAVKAKLERKLGLFDLIGCDFMIDEDFKVWLLEMNCNPALHTNCQVLKEVVPRTVTETLDLTLEIFHKCRNGLKLLPLASQRDFVLLYGGSPVPVQQSKMAGPLRSSYIKSAAAHRASPRTLKAATASAAPGVKPNASTPAGQAPPSQRPMLAETTRSFTQIRRTWKSLPKPAHSRLELRISRCTWEQPPFSSELHRPAPRNRGRSNIISLSTPALTSESQASVHHLRNKPSPSQKDQCLSSCLRPTQLPPSQGQPGISVWACSAQTCSDTEADSKE